MRTPTARKLNAPAKSERIELRTTARTKALLSEAAAASEKNVTEFLLDAGVAAAQEALLDRRVFKLSEADWRAFQAALDRPATRRPRLARLLAGKSALE